MARKQTRKNNGPTPSRPSVTRTSGPTFPPRSYAASSPNTRRPRTCSIRDPSLDPQLVWKGKDEQDAKDLAVPVVPVYIQEKIHPQALIENLRDTAKPGEREPEMQLFMDFNGIEEFDKKVDLPARAELDQPHDSRRLAACNDQPRRERGVERQGPDHLL